MDIFFEFKLIFALFATLSSIFYFWKKFWNYKNKANSKLITHHPYATYQILWNLIFWSYKTQNIGKFIDVYLIQMIDGACLMYPKEKLVKASFNGINYYLLYHPDTIEEVLKSPVAIDKSWLYNTNRRLMGNGLINSSRNIWMKRRKMLNPAFYFRILEDFQEIFSAKSANLLQILHDKKETEVFDVCQLISPLALDIMIESSMGIQNKDKDRSYIEFVQAVNTISSNYAARLVKPWLWIRPISYFNPLRKRLLTYKKIIHDFCTKIIQEKKEFIEGNQCVDNFQETKDNLGIKHRRNFLDLLLYHHLTDGILSEQDVEDEVRTFMIAGFDTTSMGISWTLYLIGLHQDIQEKLFNELTEIFGDDTDRKINVEDLRKMKYLECVIKESNRIYPIIPLISRTNSSEMRIGDYIVPAKSTLVICIHALHHNPSVYDNPEIFNPDRFLFENSEKRHPFAFIPFSAGPRNCIGQKFAMMEMKTVLADIIRHFKVHSLDPPDKILAGFDVVLRAKVCIRMTLNKRRK